MTVNRNTQSLWAPISMSWLALMSCSKGPAPGSIDLQEPRVSVLPFRTEPPVQGWSEEAFAESVATRLRSIWTSSARVTVGVPPGQADYVLEGDVRTEADRTVIALRLKPVIVGVAEWTATFWRRDLADSNLAGDLARAVAIALHPENRPVPARKATREE
jgi:hypothetical protein